MKLSRKINHRYLDGMFRLILLIYGMRLKIEVLLLGEMFSPRKELVK